LERFFILGCQRTGTTLLRLVLETHPDVFCYDEMKGYAILQNSIVENRAPARFIGFKLPRWTEQLRSPVLCDEGADDYCHNFYRGEKILFLRRDVRDTIASMLKLKTGGSSWCEQWVPRIIRAKVERDAEFRARYSGELALLDQCGLPLVGLAALYWKYKTDALYDYRAAGYPVLAVSYEDLVYDPQTELRAVCRHLGLVFHPNLLHHERLPHTELFANGLTVGDTNPRQPIQAASVGQWDHYLSSDDLRLVERITGKTSVANGGHLWDRPGDMTATTAKPDW
jgi:hypothetical protein